MYTDKPVTNQAEFDAAIAAGDYPVIEDNGRYEIPRDIADGHVIRVKGAAKPILVAHGSSSPRTVAYDFSSVLHTGRGTVAADEHVTVRTAGDVAETPDG
jgi:hypothetical protein